MSIYNQLPLSEIVKEVFYIDSWLKNGDVLELDQMGFIKNIPKSIFLQCNGRSVDKKIIIKLTPEIVKTIELVLFKSAVLPSVDWFFNMNGVCSSSFLPFYKRKRQQLTPKRIPELYKKALASLQEHVNSYKVSDGPTLDFDVFHRNMPRDVKNIIFDHLDIESLISFSRVNKIDSVSVNNYISITFKNHFPIPPFKTVRDRFGHQKSNITSECQMLNKFFELKRMYLFREGTENMEVIELIQAPAPFKVLCIAMFPSCREFIQNDKKMGCMHFTDHQRTVVIKNLIIKPLNVVFEYKNGKRKCWMQTDKECDSTEDYPIMVLRECSGLRKYYEPDFL